MSYDEIVASFKGGLLRIDMHEWLCFASFPARPDDFDGPPRSSSQLALVHVASTTARLRFVHRAIPNNHGPVGDSFFAMGLPTTVGLTSIACAASTNHGRGDGGCSVMTSQMCSGWGLVRLNDETKWVWWGFDAKSMIDRVGGRL